MHGPSFLADDGVITYWSQRPTRREARRGLPVPHYDAVFRRLQADLGVKFQRGSQDSAEIFCWINPEDDGRDGYAQHLSNGKLRLQADGYHGIYRWVQAHEIGHALGLQHPADLRRTDTIMGYNLIQDYFTPLDLANLAVTLAVNAVT